MQNFDYEGQRQRILANRAKKNPGTSLVFGNQNQPSPSSATNMSQFNPGQWAQLRPIIEKHFRPEDVGKAIWTGFWENPNLLPRTTEPDNVGNPPQGKATGPFQILPSFYNAEGVLINAGRPSQKDLEDWEINVRTAAELVYGGIGKGGKNSGLPANFSDWQDNYNPASGERIWGALAKHPYPGDVKTLPPTPLPTDFNERISQATSDYEFKTGIVTYTEQKKATWQLNARKNQEKELEELERRTKDNSIIGLNIEGEIERAKQLKAINARYQAEEAEINKELAEAKLVQTKALSWLHTLGNLDKYVADSETNIRTADDLEKFINETNKYTGQFTSWINDERMLISFTPEEKAYLNRAIGHLAPYVNNPISQPTSQQQLSEFLAAASSTSLPSSRRNIASLTTKEISSIFKTLAKPTVKLPEGLDVEKLRAYYSSQNLLDEESRKALGALQGKAKNIAKEWQAINASYEAYKLGIADPTNNLPILKAREQNIVQWGLEKLEVYSSNVVRPIAAYGLSGYGSLRDSPIGGFIRVQSPLFDWIYSDEDTDELRSLIRQNRMENQNWWEAAGNGFEQWDTGIIQKMLAETIADPTTYLGFGVYTKLFKPIPYLGKAVEGVELGWKLAFDNPIATKAAFSAAGAALGYTITGGETYGAVIGAGLPTLRFIPLYTSAQLTERAMQKLNRIQNEAILTHTHRPTITSIEPDEIIDALETGFNYLKNNPTTADLTPQARWVKALLNTTNPWIDGDTVSTWAVRGREEALARTTSEFAPDSNLLFVAGKQATQDQLLQVNKILDNLMFSEERGVISLAQASDQIGDILGLSYTSRQPIQEAIIDTLESQFNRVRELFTGTNSVDMMINSLNGLKSSVLRNYEHPLTKQAQFQGFIIGLNRHISPITRSKGYQALATIQNWYARSMLSFFNFKPFNYLETHFRAALGGGGWEIPVLSDEITTAAYHHSWNSAYPQALREGGRGNVEFIRVTKGGSAIAELAKKKSLIRTMGDLVSLEFMDDLAKQKQAAAYQHRVWARFAEESPAVYAAAKQMADSIRVDLRTLGLSTNEISSRVQDMLNGFLRPDAPEYIRNLKTNVPTATRRQLVRNIAQSLQEKTNLDQLIGDKVIRDIERGRISPDMIDSDFADNLDLLLDMPAAKSEAAIKALVEVKDSLLNAVRDANDAETLQSLMRQLVDIQDSIVHNSSELNQAATTRSHSIKGTQNKTTHWDASNSAMDNYANAAGREYPAMVTAIRDRVAQFFPDQQDSLNTMLTNLANRNQLLVDTRRKVNDLYTAYRNTHGRRPTGDDLQALVGQGETIWNDYFEREALLLEQHQILADGFSPSFGDITDVTHTGLTLQSVATLLKSSGDEIAQSLVVGSSLQNRRRWVASVYGTAEAKASKLGKTAEQLGWTRESITDVYNNLRIRIGTDPETDSILYTARAELDSLRKDVQMHVINSGYDEATIDQINNAYERFARFAEEAHNIQVEYPDLTPQFINPEDVGNGLKSRFKPDFSDNKDISYVVNETRLHVQPRHFGEPGYELTIVRDGAFNDAGTWEGRFTGRSRGSDLGSLADVGRIIDDLQRSNPNTIFTANPGDARRERIYKRAGFVDADGLLAGEIKLDKIKNITPAPVARPGTGTRTLTVPNEELRDSITRTYEKARLDFQHIFTDYTNENIFDAFMRGIFPFWFYQASRWPYLATEAFKHPGLISGFGRYQNYTEKGYTHIPGADLAFNVARGTILMGGMSGLIRQFPARYEDGALGEFAHGIDQLGRAGFYPGIWATLPLTAGGVTDFELPPILESAINISLNNPVLSTTFFADVREKYFPSKFRDYYQSELASKLSQEANLGVSGSDIRRKLELGTATDEEKAVWEQARRNLAGYQLLFDQTGILKLDIEAKREAAREAAEFIYQKTGITLEQQDAITDRLQDSGYRILDIFPLDPASSKQLYEGTRYKYWSGSSTALNPPAFQKMQDKINNFWDDVEKIQKQARDTGFEDRNGKHIPSLRELDEQFRSGDISAKEYLKSSSSIKTKQAERIDALKQSDIYKGVPITLEDRKNYRDKHGMPMPVEHPATELIRYYHEITVQDKDGEPQWDLYFASIDGLLEALPEDKRNYLLDYIQRDWTPTQKLYWQINKSIIRPYMNLREGILQAVTPEQQSFLRDYEDATPASIKNLSEEEGKLISEYNSALSRARERYRQLDPESEAWLFYWGKLSTFQSDKARRIYNDIVRRNGGGILVNTPVDETKKRLLPSLPERSN